MIVTVIYWISAALLVGAALLGIVRVNLGPTLLNRAVAADLVTSVGIGLTVLIIVWWNRQDLLVLLVLFALTGFFSAVSVSRFADRGSALERRILSPEEAQRRAMEDRKREERQEALEALGIDTGDDTPTDEPEDGEQ